MTYREHLIATGFIRPRTPVLRMDVAGRVAAQRHQEEYWAKPLFYQNSPFFQEPPEEN